MRFFLVSSIVQNDTHFYGTFGRREDTTSTPTPYIDACWLWRGVTRGEARRGEARRGDREQYDCYESMVSDPPPHVYPLRPPTIYAHHSFPEEKLGTVTFSFASCGEREGNEKKKHIHTHTHLYICCCYFVAFRSLESYWLAGDSPPPHHPPDPLPNTDITHLFLFLPSPSLL